MSCVRRSARARPSRRSAAITLLIWAAFAASAAFAVAACVSTPKVKRAVSGAPRAVPEPLTVIVRPAGVLEPLAAPGRPTPANATAVASATASAAIVRIFIVVLLVRVTEDLRRRDGPRSRRRGRQAVQVRLPAVRDPGRREMDEEHRCRGPRLHAQRHRDLLRKPVALPHVAGRARG